MAFSELASSYRPSRDAWTPWRRYAERATNMFPTMAAEGFAGPLQMLVYLTTMIAFAFSLLTLPR